MTDRLDITLTASVTLTQDDDGDPVTLQTVLDVIRNRPEELLLFPVTRDDDQPTVRLHLREAEDRDSEPTTVDVTFRIDTR